MADRARGGSLTHRTIRKVAIRIGVVVAVATVVSFWHVREGLERQSLDQLEKYVEQRRVRESAVFVLASDHLDTFIKAYGRGLSVAADEDPNPRFAALFETRPDGTTRLRRQVFEDHGVSGFIGKHTFIDDDLRRRLIVAYDLLANFGPAWRARFVNLYVVTPEHAVLMYWPGEPWALDASDWEINGKLSLVAAGGDEVIVVDPSAPGLAAEARWSDLYFDYGVNDWMVSTTEPARRDGVHLLSVGHDILLEELFARVLTADLDGTYNLLFRDDGRLIAHPRFMEAIQAQSGELSIPAADDPHLGRIFDLARRRPDGQVVIENHADDEFLAVTQLQGPEWYLVTVFPRELIVDLALDTAQLVLVAGALALLAEIVILTTVLKRQVADPLRELTRATRDVASGHWSTEIKLRRDDELGQLADAFNGMAREIDARETALNERSGRLADVNARLAAELAERERAEREVARHREALYQSEKMNALGSMLAGIAHELNNPLSVVVGRAMLLQETLPEGPHAASIARIRSAAERCARIVKTFLRMARQEAPTRQRVRIDEVIRNAVDMTQYGMPAAGVDVSYDAADDIPEIPADPNQLVQVLTNLLVNARQALGDRPPPRWIRITTAMDEDERHVAVRVADNGPGIPCDIIARVFEPFFTTKPEGEGTGLGLSVSRGLVEAHGGTINVHAPEEGGTVFTIKLPLGDAMTAPEAETTEPRRDLPACRILVVEDELEIADMLVEILSPLGHQIEVANSGRIALSRLDGARFDLVLSDLRMPDLDGAGLFQVLRDQDQELAARVIFVTGDSLSDAARQFLADADRPVIEKPFTPEEVRRLVGDALAGYPRQA